MENGKRLWVAKGRSGQEYLYVGDKPPKKLPNGMAWAFDGVVIPLPKGCIRNLTRRYPKFEDKPIEINNGQQNSVLHVRNLKNKVLHHLLTEKYGESGRKQGFLQECGKENDKRLIRNLENGDEENEK